MIKHFLNKKGFTILETIVALAIISVVVAGVFSAVRTGLVASVNSKDEIRAFYFAQEALETLRNKRDTNKLISFNTGTSVDWRTGFAAIATDPCYPSNKICTIDATTQSIIYCGTSWGSCPFLRQDPSTHMYGHNNLWITTKYRREIQLESINANELMITISVKWSHGLKDKELKVKTTMLNWR